MMTLQIDIDGDQIYHVFLFSLLCVSTVCINIKSYEEEEAYFIIL